MNQNDFTARIAHAFARVGRTNCDYFFYSEGALSPEHAVEFEAMNSGLNVTKSSGGYTLAVDKKGCEWGLMHDPELPRVYSVRLD